MDQHRYHRLLEAMCDHLGVAQREAFLRSGLLEIGGNALLLRYDEQDDADSLQIRIDLGIAPAAARGYLWRQLLHCNYVWGQGGYLVFSVIPDTAHVVLTLRHALGDATTGAELASWLRFAAHEATSQWRHILAACMASAASEQSQNHMVA